MKYVFVSYPFNHLVTPSWKPLFKATASKTYSFQLFTYMSEYFSTFLITSWSWFLTM